MQLWSDFVSATNNAVPLIYFAFEADHFKDKSQRGCKLLRAMLETLPYNKIVEDAHPSLYDYMKKGGTHSKGTTTLMQHVFIAQGLLDTLGIPHPAAVSKEALVDK